MSRDQYQTTSHAENIRFVYEIYIFSQTFQAGMSGDLSSVHLWLGSYQATPTYDLIVEIQGVAGGEPDGNVLATETMSAPGDVSNTPSEITITFGTPATLSSGTDYAIVCKSPSSTGTDYYNVYGDSGNNYYADGSHLYSNDNGGSWTNRPLYDAWFETYVELVEQALINETITLSDLVEFSEVIEGDTVTITDDIFVQPSLEKLLIGETITLSDANSATKVQDAFYATKVVRNGTKLYICCDHDPLQIVEVNIAGDTPTFSVYEVEDSGETLRNGKDLSLNPTLDSLYVACNDGMVGKFQLSDLSIREEIDTGETTQLLKAGTVDDLKVTFASLNPLLRIDESLTVKINTNFNFLKEVVTKISTMFSYIFGKIVNCDFRYLVTNKVLVNTDFRYLLEGYGLITPITRPDFVNTSITIDSVVLAVGDIVDNSVIIRWVAEEPSEASFVLARHHDKINHTIAGVASQITNNNAVVITLKGREVFTGKIESVDCSGEEERITVKCKGTRRNPNYVTTDLPLCGVEETRHLYHVINNNVTINKAIDDYDDPDKEPSIYKGIQIDLGNAEWERDSDSAKSSLMSIEEFENFKPKQNYTYFWFVTAYNWAEKYSISNYYVGTSLTSLSDGLWTDIQVSYIRQRFFDNTILDNGNYTVGSAPYKEISVKSGSFHSRSRWEDKEDGLYRVRGEWWEWENYARGVADVEYEKLKDINGDIGIFTESTVTLTIDALLYYNLGLLNKINITNTTEAGIYKNDNGFPLRIKEVSIDSNTMIVTLTLDNQKTQQELEELDINDYPTFPGTWRWFISGEWGDYSSKKYTKYDINANEEVE